jgi:hypothetical protein
MTCTWRFLNDFVQYYNSHAVYMLKNLDPINQSVYTLSYEELVCLSIWKNTILYCIASHFMFPLLDFTVFRKSCAIPLYWPTVITLKDKHVLGCHLNIGWSSSSYGQNLLFALANTLFWVYKRYRASVNYTHNTMPLSLYQCHARRPEYLVHVISTFELIFFFSFEVHIIK